jgi:hypothetical protein
MVGGPGEFMSQGIMGNHKVCLLHLAVVISSRLRIKAPGQLCSLGKCPRYTFDFINGYRPSTGNFWDDFLLANSITGLSTLSYNVEGLGAGYGYKFNPLTDTLLISSAPVPIPPAILLLGTGLIGLIGVRRRFKG